MTWPLHIKLNKSNYPISVVQRTVYALARDLSIIIDGDEDSNHIVLNVQPTIIISDQNPNTLDSDKAREIVIRMLNDFILRERVGEETRGLREIIAHAALKEAGIRP